MCAFFEFYRGLVFGVVALSAITSSACLDLAWAEVTITGTSDNVEVAANGASLEELLSALSDKFDFSYRSRVPFDQKVDGTYAGSLTRVVKQLLIKYDYVLKSENGELLIIVIDQQNPAARPNSLASLAPQPASPTPQTAIAVGTDKADPTGGKSAKNPSLRKNAGVQATTPPPRRPTSSELATIMQTQRNPSAVTAFMQTQASTSVLPDSNVAPSSPLAVVGPTVPSEAVIAESLQRANANLQALRAALTRISP